MFWGELEFGWASLRGVSLEGDQGGGLEAELGLEIEDI